MIPIPWMYDLTVFLSSLLVYPAGLKVIGKEKLPKTGRLIVAGNHVGNMDPFVITVAAKRRLRFLAKKELYGNPIMKWYMLKVGNIPVDRQSKSDIASIRACIKALEEEEGLGIFPQGTRGGSEVMGGVALIALKGKAPIMPVYVEKKGKWIVRFGELIEPQGTVPELTRKFADALENLKKL